MRFGGTEQQILQRGTDWCAEPCPVGVALLNCAGIPARIGHLVNPDRPYNGHVVVEAHYDGRFGALDFVYGSRFGAAAPLSLWELHRSPQQIRKQIEPSLWDYYEGLYKMVAVSDYDPADPANDYTVSTPNEYYRKLMSENQQDGPVADGRGPVENRRREETNGLSKRDL